MARNFSPPYLLPSDEAVDMQPWKFVDGAETVLLPYLVDDWVTGTDLRVSRGVTVDIETVRRECRLPSDAQLGLVVSWMSKASKIRRRVFRKRLEEHRNEIAITLPGAEVGGTIELATTVCLLEDIVALRS